MDTMAVLNTKVAPGSSVIVVGVADARVLYVYEGLIEKIHPFGAVRQDVTFLNMYTTGWNVWIWAAILVAWLTNNATVRSITAGVFLISWYL